MRTTVFHSIHFPHDFEESDELIIDAHQVTLFYPAPHQLLWRYARLHLWGRLHTWNFTFSSINHILVFTAQFGGPFPVWHVCEKDGKQMNNPQRWGVGGGGGGKRETTGVLVLLIQFAWLVIKWSKVLPTTNHQMFDILLYFLFIFIWTLGPWIDESWSNSVHYNIYYIFYLYYLISIKNLLVIFIYLLILFDSLLQAKIKNIKNTRER